jgi:hypothetical protein
MLARVVKPYHATTRAVSAIVPITKKTGKDTVSLNPDKEKLPSVVSTPVDAPNITNDKTPVANTTQLLALHTLVSVW